MHRARVRDRVAYLDLSESDESTLIGGEERRRRSLCRRDALKSRELSS